jgi:GTP pyrophosphokinase
MVKVGWGKPTSTYPVPVRVIAFDRQGLMGDVSNLLTSEGVNIVKADVRVNRTYQDADTADIRLSVEVKDIAQLSRVLSRIENLPNVLEARRLKPGSSGEKPRTP